MKAVQTIKNIMKIEDLRRRILITVFLVILYRLGTFIVLPGINPADLTALQASTKGGLLALLDMFSGGAFSNASIFALGIMPYISASIVMQLMAIVVPSMQKMQREGESGRRKINQYTRYLTILILFIQAPVYLINLQNKLIEANAMLPSGFSFRLTSTIILTAGSMFILWLGEKITDKGIGNGVSFIILIGIIARFPGALVAEISMRTKVGAGGLFLFVFEILVLLLVIAGAILLVQGTRRVPVQYAKRQIGNKQYGGARQYIPLKVNAANVMPIIFAQAIMFLPLSFLSFTDAQGSGFLAQFIQARGFWYNFIFAFLIIIFTYFYTAVTINPNQMADDLKRNNGFVPGIKPGKATKNYIDDVMSKITLPGAIFLAIVAILPAFAMSSTFGVNPEFAQFFGSTSLIILVGVVLDTLQQIESHLLMHHYEGFSQGGRIKGRSSGMY